MSNVGNVTEIVGALAKPEALLLVGFLSNLINLVIAIQAALEQDKRRRLPRPPSPPDGRG